LEFFLRVIQPFFAASDDDFFFVDVFFVVVFLVAAVFLPAVVVVSFLSVDFFAVIFFFAFFAVAIFKEENNIVFDYGMTKNIGNENKRNMSYSSPLTIK